MTVTFCFPGLLGIGGGMIVNPLLLEFNIHPQAAAATSTLMVLFSSSSAALSFGFGHQLNLHFALIFGLCCMGASLVGVLLVQRMVKRSGKVFLCFLTHAQGELSICCRACPKYAGEHDHTFIRLRNHCKICVLSNRVVLG